ncbi:MAG TPA: ABC transporter substrate-binding protein [Stellaceae bacterium]|jgi:ABC-type nitrate/sulfonate/bicarbonate transport system substrate-binding protein|nr:ABC transporter substrate-binding protein [Stellaceae bacterium]
MKLIHTIALAALAVALGVVATCAHAEDAIRFGKAFPTLFQFTPVDLGIEKGFFKKRGLEVEIQNFFGDAKQQQAYTAGAVDMGIGGGAGMGFIAKGSPILAVAEAAGPPLGITLSVWADTPYKTVADLKGQTVTGASVGDQTEWMVRQLSILQGWGPTGFNYVPLGASEAQIAALKTHQIAAAPLDITTAVSLETQGQARIVVRFGKVIQNYINHVISATNGIMEKHPDDVRNFLAGWFESVAYLKAHKEESVALAARILKQPEAIVSRVYDESSPMLTDNGHFDQKGLATIRDSLVEMKILETKPDMAKLTTEKFLPN